MTEEEHHSAPRTDDAVDEATVEAQEQEPNEAATKPERDPETAFEEFAASWVPPWARSQPELIRFSDPWMVLFVRAQTLRPCRRAIRPTSCFSGKA